MITIDLSTLYIKPAKLHDLKAYIDQALEKAGEGNEIILTGSAPIWLYLSVAHALHGKAKKLIYCSPPTGNVVIFNHDSF